MNRTHVGWMVTAIVVASLWNVPAIADVVADFAKNSHRVDGIHAVRAGASEEKRAKKLVATDAKGHLPDYIVKNVERADNADTIDHYDSARIVMECNRGSVAGYAFVPADVGPDFTEVDGVGMTKTTGGPPPPPGHPNDACSPAPPDARRVATGTYEVRLFGNIASCDFATNLSPAALVSVRDTRPLIASYERACAEGEITLTVRVFDHAGTATDAAFTVAAMESPTIFFP